MSSVSVPQQWRFDHAGVVVKSLEKGRKHFSEALGVNDWSHPLVDRVNGVHLQFGRDASLMVYELLSPLDADSPVAGALAARKNLLNHVAYRVRDLAEAAAALRDARCFPAGEPKPAIAFGGAMIQFFVTPIDTIVELIEAYDFAHDFRPLAVSQGER
ncbi:VOC family protein [Sphingomonas sp.]|uniref:VOC family protein n=1 Tax=Sphingomonas sp. TaxID=28214 RepID=UPI002E37C0F3|nr:VOC family protein [Sphingomonas sp.]HEX4695897.1 VOC family protein [Sphingomonas sp.]